MYNDFETKNISNRNGRRSILYEEQNMNLRDVIQSTARTTRQTSSLPNVGELVRVRSRTWLVDEVIEPKIAGQTCVVRLTSCFSERSTVLLSIGARGVPGVFCTIGKGKGIVMLSMLSN
jgi:hypothetical protein